MKRPDVEALEVTVATAAFLVLLVQSAFLWRRRWWLGALMLEAAGSVALLLGPLVKRPTSALVDSALLQRALVAGFLWGVAAFVGTVVLFNRRTVARVGLAALVVGSTFLAEWIVIPQWRVSRSVFVDGPVAHPTSTQGSLAQPEKHERFNILLLGGDAGPGRWGLRTDAIHLVSIDASLNPDDGVVVISIPRNLQHAPMPPGLADEFPDGFTNIANGVFGWGEAHAADVERAVGATDEPGASLVAAIVAELTGMRVDGWVLTDMRGFIDIVDAAGGVDVWVDKFIKAPGSAFGGLTPAHDFVPGWQKMNGADALSFARAREQDSDYHRMARQRCVLASLAAQMTASELLLRWPLIAGAIANHVRTNLAPDQVVHLRAMTGLQSRDIKVLSLVPPYVSGSNWTLDEVRTLVHNAVYGTSQPVVIPGHTTPVTSGDTSVTDDPRWTCKVTKFG